MAAILSRPQFVNNTSPLDTADTSNESDTDPFVSLSDIASRLLLPKTRIYVFKVAGKNNRKETFQ